MGRRPKIRIANEIENDKETKQDKDLEAIFADLPDIYKVIIHRQDPTWCDGYLGTLEFSRERPFNIDWLRSNFGGRKYSLKIQDATGSYLGSKTVKLPDPPRSNGKQLEQGIDGHPVFSRDPLNNPSQFQDNNRLLEKVLELLITKQEAAPASIPAPAPLDGKLTEMLLGRINTLETMLFAQLSSTARNAQQHTTPANAPPDPLDQIKQFAALIKNIEDLKKGLAPEFIDNSQREEPENKAINMALERLIDNFTAPKATQPTQGAQGPPPLPPPSTAPAGPQDVTQTFKAEFDGASPQKRQEMLKIVLGPDFEIDDIDELEEDLLSAEDQQALE